MHNKPAHTNPTLNFLFLFIICFLLLAGTTLFTGCTEPGTASEGEVGDTSSDDETMEVDEPSAEPETTENLCVEETCSGNGTCIMVDNNAACDCNDGFFAENMECKPNCGNNTIDDDELCDGDDLGENTCSTQNFGEEGILSCAEDCTFDSSDCHTCGNDHIEAQEICDGDDVNESTCSSLNPDQQGQILCNEDCTFDFSDCYNCGNGQIEGPEQCDGGNLNEETCISRGFDGGELFCLGDCTLNPIDCYVCGDDTVAGHEECDGNDMDGRSCVSEGYTYGALFCDDCHINTSNCIAVCGNNRTEVNESCDGTEFRETTCADFEYSAGQISCTPNCTLDISDCSNCGNGIVDPTEECDGNVGEIDCVGFSPNMSGEPLCINCRINYEICTGQNSECGNGILEPELGEHCDQWDLGSKTCESEFPDLYEGGVLLCYENCLLNTTFCRIPVIDNCGNGVIESEFGEECDGEDLADQNCEDLGYPGGTLRCKDCRLDESNCTPIPTCGNGTIEDGELCDGDNLGGSSCTFMEFLGGTLSCNRLCKPDTSECNNCGNGIRDSGEECEGEDLGGLFCQDLGFSKGELRCYDNCLLDDSDCEHCSQELCNGADENCNGIIDDTFYIGEACDGDDSDQCKTGTFVCSLDDETLSICRNESEENIVEICDGVDNDCDGTPDEDFECVQNSQESCVVPDCGNGSKLCSSSCEWEECIITEVCDGHDNDCDNEVDEDFDCIPGRFGECVTWCGSTGSTYCGQTCEWEECINQNETCNGEDDDCDGHYDEVNYNVSLFRLTRQENVQTRYPFDNEWNGSQLGICWIWEDYRTQTVTLLFNRVWIEDGEWISGEDVRVSEYSDSPTECTMAWTGNGWGIAWTDISGNYPQLKFQLLDAEGILELGEPAELTNSPYPSEQPVLATSGDHFGISWTDTINNQQNLMFMSFDVEGNPIAAETNREWGRPIDFTWTGNFYALLDSSSASHINQDMQIVTPNGAWIAEAYMRMDNATRAGRTVINNNSEFFVSGREYIYRLVFDGEYLEIGNSWRSRYAQDGLTQAPERNEFIGIKKTSEIVLQRFQLEPGNMNATPITEEITISMPYSTTSIPHIFWTGEYYIAAISGRDSGLGRIYVARIGCAQ